MRIGSRAVRADPGAKVHDPGGDIDDRGRKNPPMVIDQVEVDVLRSVDRGPERALPQGRAVIGIECEDLIGHGREQHQIAGAAIGQSDPGHDQGLRLGAAAVTRQRQREQASDAAAADGRPRQYAFLRIGAVAAIVVGARGDRDEAYRTGCQCDCWCGGIRFAGKRRHGQEPVNTRQIGSREGLLHTAELLSSALHDCLVDLGQPEPRHLSRHCPNAANRNVRPSRSFATNSLR